jgi:hypothetical protein
MLAQMTKKPNHELYYLDKNDIPRIYINAY